MDDLKGNREQTRPSAPRTLPVLKNDAQTPAVKKLLADQNEKEERKAAHYRYHASGEAFCDIVVRGIIIPCIGCVILMYYANLIFKTLSNH